MPTCGAGAGARGRAQQIEDLRVCGGGVRRQHVRKRRAAVDGPPVKQRIGALEARRLLLHERAEAAEQRGVALQECSTMYRSQAPS